MKHSKSDSPNRAQEMQHKAHNLLFIIDFSCELLTEQVSISGQPDLEKIKAATQDLKKLIQGFTARSLDQTV